MWYCGVQGVFFCVYSGVLYSGVWCSVSHIQVQIPARHPGSWLKEWDSGKPWRNGWTYSSGGASACKCVVAFVV